MGLWCQRCVSLIMSNSFADDSFRTQWRHFFVVSNVFEKCHRLFILRFGKDSNDWSTEHMNSCRSRSVAWPGLRNWGGNTSTISGKKNRAKPSTLLLAHSVAYSLRLCHLHPFQFLNDSGQIPRPVSARIGGSAPVPHPRGYANDQSRSLRSCRAQLMSADIQSTAKRFINFNALLLCLLIRLRVRLSVSLWLSAYAAAPRRLSTFSPSAFVFPTHPSSWQVAYAIGSISKGRGQSIEATPTLTD